MADEDPKLAARLTEPVGARRRRVTARIGWAMLCVATVLLFCGNVLRDASMVALAVLLLAGCWVPWWRAREAARGSRS